MGGLGAPEMTTFSFIIKEFFYYIKNSTLFFIIKSEGLRVAGMQEWGCPVIGRGLVPRWLVVFPV